MKQKYNLLSSKDGSKRRMSQIRYRKNSLYNAIESLQVACSPSTQIRGSVKNHYLAQDVESKGTKSNSKQTTQTKQKARRSNKRINKSISSNKQTNNSKSSNKQTTQTKQKGKK